MKKKLLPLFAAVLIFILPMGASAFQSQDISQIIAFGDSYSDNGAAYEVTSKMVNAKVKDSMVMPDEKLYWNHHWTNGMTAVELMAGQMNVKLTNYAIGGAKSGPDNYYTWMNGVEDTGAMGQINKFLSQQKSQSIDPSALYFIFVSANDYFQHTDYNLSGSIGEVANTSVKNICAAVEKLSQAGAKYFMIVGSMDLKVLPAVVGAGQVQLAQEFQSSVNHQLAIKVEALEQDLRISIEFFNPIDVTSKIQNDPAMYGISNLTSPCQPTWPEVKPSCGNPDAYYMWDEWHISLRVNQWLGKAMVEELVD